MTVTEHTRASFEALVLDEYEEVSPRILAQVQEWFDRGDGAAIYQNHDLGHRDLGRLQIVSYGSAAAQLEVEVPPQRLPDIGAQINWRYQLVGTYRPGGALTLERSQP